MKFEHNDQQPAPSAAVPTGIVSAPTVPQAHTIEIPQEHAPPNPAPTTPLPTVGTQVPADHRAGLPPVDHKPAEAPLKDLFPKPSQGDSPSLGELRRREKPQRSDATNDPTGQKRREVRLGGLGKPSKQRRSWVPLALATVTVTILATAALLVLDPSGSEENPNASIPNAEPGGPNPATSKTLADTHSRLAGLLASMTRPAAVITVDVAALKEREWTNAIPRITNWFQKYLKLPINDVEQIVAVGAAADDFSIAITTSTPLTSPTLTERLGVPHSKNVYHLAALSGPLAVRLLDDATLIVSHRDKASSPPDNSPLPAPLKQQLQSAAGNVLLSIDHELIDKGNIPFFLPQAGDMLKSKTATISVANSVQLKVATEHTTNEAAAKYAKGYSQALAGSLQRFKEIDKANVSAAAKSIKTKATDQTAQVFWGFVTGQDKLAQCLIEMIADPLGTEVANASVQVLRQEAQRVAALFYTAKNARAPLDGATSTESAIMLLMKGVESSQDDWVGRPFRTRAYSSWEREVLAKFLEFDGSDLEFQPNGIQPEDLGKVIQSQHAATEESTPDPTETKSRLDAASIAAAYDAAKTAGAPLEKISELDTALDQLTKGIETKGSRFAVQLSAEERERAKVFLRFQGDKIILVEAAEE